MSKKVPWGVSHTVKPGRPSENKAAPIIGSRPHPDSSVGGDVPPSRSSTLTPGSRGVGPTHGGSPRGRTFTGGVGSGRRRGSPNSPLPVPPKPSARPNTPPQAAQYGAPGSLGAPRGGGSLGAPRGGGSLGAPQATQYGVPGSLGAPRGGRSLGAPRGGGSLGHPRPPPLTHSSSSPALYGAPGSLGSPTVAGGGGEHHSLPATIHDGAVSPGGGVGVDSHYASSISLSSPVFTPTAQDGTAVTYGVPGRRSLGPPSHGGGGLGAPMPVPAGSLGVPITRSSLSSASAGDIHRVPSPTPSPTPCAVPTPSQYDTFVMHPPGGGGGGGGGMVGATSGSSAMVPSPKGLERFEVKKEIAFEDLLKQLGLEKFTSKFLEEEVDEESLVLLTEDDLKDMGFPTGPRKKILRAIASMTHDAGAGGGSGSAVFSKTVPHSVARASTSTPSPDALNKTMPGGLRAPSALGSLVADRWKINYFHLDINVKDKIGEGNFGTVWKGYWRKAPCVVKKLKNLEGDEALLDWEKEVNVLMNLRPHPNLITFLGVCMSPPNLALVTEFCPLGDLSHLVKKVELPLVTKAKLALGAAAGMVHLHAEGLLHNDFAARNLLVIATETGLDVKITDFGMSRRGTEYEAVNQVMAIKWMAPEALTGKFSQQSDCWSFGMMCYELLTNGSQPYEAMDNVNAFVLIREGTTPELPAGVPDAFEQLVRKTWRVNPEDRPSFDWINGQLEDIYGSLRETGEREATVADVLGTRADSSAGEMAALEKERARLAADREKERKEIEAQKREVKEGLALLQQERQRMAEEEARRYAMFQQTVYAELERGASAPDVLVQNVSAGAASPSMSAERVTRTMPSQPSKAHSTSALRPPEQARRTRSRSPSDGGRRPRRAGSSRSPSRKSNSSRSPSRKSGSKNKSSSRHETGARPEIAKLARPSKSDMKEFAKKCSGTDINPKDFLTSSKCQTVREETGKYVEGKLYASRTTILYCFKEKSKEYKLVVPFKRIKSVWYASEETEKKGRNKRTKLVPKKHMDSNTVGILLFINGSKGTVARAFVHFGSIGDLVNLYSIAWFQQPVLKQKKGT